MGVVIELVKVVLAVVLLDVGDLVVVVVVAALEVVHCWDW